MDIFGTPKSLDEKQTAPILLGLIPCQNPSQINPASQVICKESLAGVTGQSPGYTTPILRIIATASEKAKISELPGHLDGQSVRSAGHVKQYLAAIDAVMIEQGESVAYCRTPPAGNLRHSAPTVR